jgi:hypothetical protein
MTNPADARRDVVDLERRFWTEGGGNPTFWSEHFADDGVVALPMGVLDKAQTMAAMEQAGPWAQASLDDLRILPIGDGSVALTYVARARRNSDDSEYIAVISSVYAHRDGAWVLVLHQQSPMSTS